MINRVFMAVVMSFFMAVSVFAGEKGDSLFYKRMEGAIGKKMNVTTHLIRIHNKLTGNYYYTFTGQDGKRQDGKTIELSGKMVDDTAVYIKEIGEDGYSFEGKLEDDRFTGVWHDPEEEDKSLPFEMESYYPKGSVPFDVHYLKSEYYTDRKKQESPSANIELTLVWPTGSYFRPVIIDSVGNDIQRSFFGKNFVNRLPDSMLVAFESEYYQNFDKQAGELFEKYHKVFNWEKMVSMSVLYNSNYLLTLEYLRYAYSGGSHGMTNISYDVINLRDGSLLGYESVFNENAKDTLSALLTAQLKKDYSIPAGVSLQKAGFFYDTISPNRNLYVNGNGVGFVYSSYEIAPGFQGIITVFLPFNQIEGIIKEGTPVYPLVHDK